LVEYFFDQHRHHNRQRQAALTRRLGVELRDTTPQVIPERVAKALLARSPADTSGPPTARPPG
jgi:hypothetical protein